MNFYVLRKIPLLTQQLRCIASSTNNLLENFLPTHFAPGDVRKNLVRSRSLERDNVILERNDGRKRSLSVPPNSVQAVDSKILQYNNMDCLKQARNISFLKKLFGESEKKCPVPIICERKIDKDGQVKMVCTPYDFQNPPNKRKYEAVGSSKSELTAERGKLAMKVEQVTYKKEDECAAPPKEEEKGMPVFDFKQLGAQPMCKPELQPVHDDSMTITGPTIPAKQQTQETIKEVDSWKCRDGYSKFQLMDQTIACEPKSKPQGKKPVDVWKKPDGQPFDRSNQIVKSCSGKSETIPVKEIDPCVSESKPEPRLCGPPPEKVDAPMVSESKSPSEKSKPQGKKPVDVCEKTDAQTFDASNQIVKSCSGKSETIPVKEIDPCVSESKPEPRLCGPPPEKVAAPMVSESKSPSENFPCPVKTVQETSSEKVATATPAESPRQSSFAALLAFLTRTKSEVAARKGSQPASQKNASPVEYQSTTSPSNKPCEDNTSNINSKPELQTSAKVDPCNETNTKSSAQFSTTEPYKIKYASDPHPRDPNEEACPKLPFWPTSYEEKSSKNDLCKKSEKVKELCPTKKAEEVVSDPIPIIPLCPKTDPTDAPPKKVEPNLTASCPKNDSWKTSASNSTQVEEKDDPYKKILSGSSQPIAYGDPKDDQECEQREPVVAPTIMRDPATCEIPKQDPRIDVEIREPKFEGTMICDNCDPCKSKKNKCDPGCPESRKPKRAPVEGTCNRFCPDDSADDSLECRRCKKYEICEDPKPKPKPIDCSACPKIETPMCPPVTSTASCPRPPPKPMCTVCPPSTICCPKPKPKPICPPKCPPPKPCCPEVVPVCPTPNVCCHEPDEDVKYREPLVEDVLATEDKPIEPCPVKEAPPPPKKPSGPPICPSQMSHTNWVPVPIKRKQPGASLNRAGKCGATHFDKECVKGYARASDAKHRSKRRTPNLSGKLPKTPSQKKGFLEGFKGLVRSAQMILPGTGKKDGKKAKGVAREPKRNIPPPDYLYKLPEMGDNGKLNRSEEVWPFLVNAKTEKSGAAKSGARNVGADKNDCNNAPKPKRLCQK